MTCYKLIGIYEDRIYASYEDAAIAAINFAFICLEKNKHIKNKNIKNKHINNYMDFYYKTLCDFIIFVNNKQYKKAMQVISTVAECQIFIQENMLYTSQLIKLDDKINKIIHRKMKEQVFK